MPFIKNVSEKPIIHNIEGVEVVFQPGMLVPFKDRSMAIFHSSLAEVTASPADGRKASRPLVLVEDRDVTDNDLLKAATPAPKPELPATPNTFVPPTPGHVAKPDAETLAFNCRKELNKCDKDLLVSWCKKHNLYKPYMDKPRMVDALASIGFKPPVGFKR